MFEISIYEKELPFLSAENLKYEVIETVDASIGFVRIRLNIKDNYELVRFGLAMNKCGFEEGKRIWVKSQLHAVDHNPAIEQSIEDNLFKDDFEHERFQREVNNA